MSLDVPEAWSLDRVRDVVQAVKDGKDVGQSLGLTDRHVAYHLQAARILGWLNKVQSKFNITRDGESLLSSSKESTSECSLMRAAVLNSALVRTVLPSLGTGMTHEQISLSLAKHPDTNLAPTTANKRAGYLLKWLARIGGPLEATSPPDASDTRNLNSHTQSLSVASQDPETKEPYKSDRVPGHAPSVSSKPVNSPRGNPLTSAPLPADAVKSVNATSASNKKANESKDIKKSVESLPNVSEGVPLSTLKNARSFQSEIRTSEINILIAKVNKQNYSQYLRGLRLVDVRGFKDQLITFDFPVTALIGPNGGGKTTILGAAACAYKKIPPRQFFAKSGRFDDSMQDWSIEYQITDKRKDAKNLLRRNATFRKSKWYRDPLEREVIVSGVARTVPATERVELRKFASSSFEVPEEKISKLTKEVISAAQAILGKRIDDYTHMRIGKSGKVTLLAGMTSTGTQYSEFHFGAGESSVIRMAISLDAAEECALILIEEIENGLHPVATIKMVEYLIGIAIKKKLQVIFTTHSQHALLPLPNEAIWAAVERRAFQGRLSIDSLRAINSQIDAQLAIFTEDDFAVDWIRGILRAGSNAALDAIEIHAMAGDGTAVRINNFHNQDPSTRFRSICIIDGDSQQRESDDDFIFRLPGAQPEACVFEEVLHRLDECAGKLTIALHLNFAEEARVRETLKKVGLSNKDPHLLFNQVAEKLGFLSELVVRGAFISSWCELFSAKVAEFIQHFEHLLPRSID